MMIVVQTSKWERLLSRYSEVIYDWLICGMKGT